MSEKKFNVLIVDDIPKNIQVLSSILNQKGLKISFATSGSQAIRTVESNKPDLILLDIMMPEMDGYETCEIIKSNPEFKDIPIIFLTAKTQQEDIIKGFEAGAVDYITKPFNPSELIKRIFTHIELKASRDLIYEQNKQLKNLNATKDKFFSIIAHDLKNPFGNVVCFLDLLLDNFDSYSHEEIKKYIATIYQSANKGYDLLEHLLEWSRVQTGRIQFKPHLVDVYDLVNETFNLLESSAIKKNIKLKSSVIQNSFIFADKNMLKTILRNLVFNAIKFSHPDSEITIQNVNDKDMAYISVEDKGVGIKAEDLEKVFKLDENFSTPGTANETGTGLGLMLCKEFVEKNGGKLTIKSEYGKGTKILFSVPLPKTNEKNKEVK